MNLKSTSDRVISLYRSVQTVDKVRDIRRGFFSYKASKSAIFSNFWCFCSIIKVSNKGDDTL